MKKPEIKLRTIINLRSGDSIVANTEIDMIKKQIRAGSKWIRINVHIHGSNDIEKYVMTDAINSFQESQKEIYKTLKP